MFLVDPLASCYLPTNTRLRDGRTPTPHITNLGLLTFLGITGGSLIGLPPLVRVMQIHEVDIPFHGLGDAVPKVCVQRRLRIPPTFDKGCIGVPRGVLEFVPWTGLGGIQLVVGGDIAEEVVGIVHAEIARVDLVQSETAVHVGHGRDAGTDPARHERRVGGLDARVAGVVDGELVLVGVAEEDVGDDMRRVPVHDLVKEVARVGHRDVSVPAAGDV